MTTDLALGPLTEKLTLLPPNRTIVVRGGTLIDGAGGRPIADATIVIDGDRIGLAGRLDTGQIPSGDGVEVVDATGLTVLPGLIDAHVHYLGDVTGDSTRMWLEPSLELRTIRAALDLYRTLEGGFTTVRSLGHGSPDQAIALKRAIDEGVILGPRMLTCGWAISQTGGHGHIASWRYDLVEQERPRSGFADGPEGVRLMVRRNFAAGADLTKYYATQGAGKIPNFTLAEIEAMADETHRRRAKLAAHATGEAGMRHAILGGTDTIEHGTIQPVPELLDMMAERGIILVPTYAVCYFTATEGAEWGAASRVDAARRRSEQRYGALEEARRRGVKVALGTDTGHRVGIGVARNAKELELLVDAGLTPMEALVAGTRHGAEALGLEEDLGTLEPGKLAELILVKGDPLADIRLLQTKSNVVRVFKSTTSLT